MDNELVEVAQHIEEPEDLTRLYIAASLTRVRQCQDKPQFDNAGRALALTMTKLEEARMWFDKAVAQADHDAKFSTTTED